MSQTMIRARGIDGNIPIMAGVNDAPVHLNAPPRVSEMTIEQRWMETIEHRWEQRKEREASGFYEPSAWVSK